MYGIATGVGHGFGILLWVSLTAVGVAKMLVDVSVLLLSAQFLGACLLAYIGYRTLGSGLDLTARPMVSGFNQTRELFRGTGEGFMISLLNPKIALFFLAIFS
jgi:threonine/homoserine/homoserine lactone efflux protein